MRAACCRRGAMFGNAGCPARASFSTASRWPRMPKYQPPATTSTARTVRISVMRGFMAASSGVRQGAATHADEAEHDRQHRQYRGNEHDVEQAQPGLEPVDVALEVELHAPQLLARVQDLAVQLHDGGLLIRRQHRGRGARLAAALP